MNEEPSRSFSRKVLGETSKEGRREGGKEGRREEEGRERGGKTRKEEGGIKKC